MDVLRQGVVRADSFVHGHSAVVLAMGDQKRYGDLGDVIDRRNPLEEFSDFRDGLVAILAPACGTPNCRGILQERRPVDDSKVFDTAGELRGVVRQTSLFTAPGSENEVVIQEMDASHQGHVPAVFK